MPCPKDPSRTDAKGRAHAGSQRQIQTYVNERPSELCHAVTDALQPSSIDALPIRWVSPLEADAYSEYRDGEFLELIGLGHLAPKLREFWPRGGPCWDALGQADGGRCVLIEAKSHVPEVYGIGCAASGASLSLINSSLERTKSWLEVRPNADWLHSLYQSANRLAHLYFLREIGNIEAFLVNVYFIADPHSLTSRQEWNDGIKLANEHLGITNRIPHSGSVFLNAV